MRRLILFAGLPGVGKSTLSRRVGERTEATVVDIDDFKQGVVDPTLVTNQVDPPDLRWLYYRKALEYVFGLFNQGRRTVILDETFHLDSLRGQLQALCAEQSVQVLWVEVRCPYDAVERRLRSHKRDGHILSTEEALRMHLMFMDIFEQFPANYPNYVVVNNENDTDVDDLVASILEKIA